MTKFLHLHSIEEAESIFYQKLKWIDPGSETLAIENAVARVLAEDIVSEEFLPAFSRSGMDGFAVIAKDTFGASESQPAYLQNIGEVPMGGAPGFKISKGQTAVIHTGGMLPEGADAVVMLETAHFEEMGLVEIYKPVAVSENVLLKGEDGKPGDLLLEKGTLLKPEDVAGLLSIGKTLIKVYKTIKIGIISSGDELVLPSQKPEYGQVRDINSGSMAALVQGAGCQAVNYPIVKDDFSLLEMTVQQAWQECDAVLITAGSSASTRDVTADVINRIGKPGVLVHGINIRPGKPTILAVCNGKPVIGLPGNPISALVIARRFIKPLINWMRGLRKQEIEPYLIVELKEPVASQSGRDEYIPVQIINVGAKIIAKPVFFKSNLIFTLVKADGLLHIPADITGYAAGEKVKVLPR